MEVPVKVKLRLNKYFFFNSTSIYQVLTTGKAVPGAEDSPVAGTDKNTEHAAVEGRRTQQILSRATLRPLHFNFSPRTLEYDLVTRSLKRLGDN